MKGLKPGVDGPQLCLWYKILLAFRILFFTVMLVFVIWLSCFLPLVPLALVYNGLMCGYSVFQLILCYRLWKLKPSTPKLFFISDVIFTLVFSIQAVILSQSDFLALYPRMRPILFLPLVLLFLLWLHRGFYDWRTYQTHKSSNR